MKKIEVESDVFERLQAQAAPFVDTPSSVIARALDALETISQQTTEPLVSRVTAYGPRNLPDMRHTKIEAVSLNDEEIPIANWNSLIEYLISLLKKHGISNARIATVRQLHLVNGEKRTDGFRYVPEADISFQGLDSNRAASVAGQIVKLLGFSIEIRFYWMAKDGAYDPGGSGVLIAGKL